MNVFGIGLPELAVIAAIGLLVFGPRRLPELGRTLGRTLKGFQSASREFEQEFRKVVDTVDAEVSTPDPGRSAGGSLALAEAEVQGTASGSTAGPAADLTPAPPAAAPPADAPGA